MNKAELEKAIEREIEEWPGVTVAFVGGGKHPKLKLSYLGNMLARPYPGTPSDSMFGIHSTLGDVRRLCKQLGAKRSKPEPSREEDEAPYRKPNDGADKRPNPVEGEPAAVKPTVAEQLVEKGLATPAQAEAASQPAVAEPVGVSDEPVDRLVLQLRDRGFDIQQVGPVSRASMIMTAVGMIEDGIYFALPMEVYRNVPRLGAGSLVDLNKSPGDFWAGSWLDPDRKEEKDEEQKKWQIVGSAYHCARLEPDEFEKRYCRKPCKADFAEQAAAHGACWNGTEVGEQLAELGETKKRAGEAVGDQALRLEGTGYAGVIWPLVDSRFQAQLGDRTPLDADVWDEIARDMERLRSCRAIASKFTDAGASEVSVFWVDENNIARKARFDRLEFDHWLDFKTFANSQGKRLEQAINDAIRFNRYYITAASYYDAAEAVRTAGLQIRGVATEAERDLIARIQIKPEHLDCWFIFQQKSGVPNLLARRFRFFDVPQSIEDSWDTGASDEAKARGHEATRRPTQIYQKGRTEIDYAKRLFALYSEVYQPGEPWAPIDQEGDVSDLDFNPNWLEGRYD